MISVPYLARFLQEKRKCGSLFVVTRVIMKKDLPKREFWHKMTRSYVKQTFMSSGTRYIRKQRSDKKYFTFAEPI